MENKRKEKVVIIISVIIAAIFGLILGFLVFKLNYSNKALIKENKKTTGQINSGTVDIGIDLATQIYAKKTIKIDVNNGSSDTNKVCKYNLIFTPENKNDSDYNYLTASGETEIIGNGIASVKDFKNIKLNTNKVVLVRDGIFEVDGANSTSTLNWNVTIKSVKENTEDKKIKGTLAIEIISCEEK